MTVTEPAPTTSGLDATTEQDSGRFRSARGKFKIFKAPKIKRRRQIPEDFDTSAIVDGFDYRGLLEDNDEADVRAKVDGMIRAINPGITETLLFSQKGPDGMSLAHVWFGANMPLFRHSHPKFGDCLYYIITGEVRLGSQVLGAGDGVFVPNEMPYKYIAGPEGVELLEFRAGGGIDGAPGMVLNEPSLDSIQQIIDVSNAQHDTWLETSPEQVHGR